MAAEEPAEAPRDASGEDLGLPPLDQIEAVLRASRAQPEEQDEELDDLRGRMGDESDGGSPPQPPIVRSSVPDNETADRWGVVRPDPVDITEKPEVGFSDMGPFLWALPGPDQPWATLSDVSMLCNALVESGADISLVVGHDFGRALCVQRETLRVVAVPLDTGGPGTRFVDAGLPQFAHCLALLGRMWPLRHGLTPRQAGRWTEEFQAELVLLDPPAPASPENWWALLLEQMWDGLL
ncbi:SUKH-4 family immunity protein [Streptomyces sp. NPDC099050]|uniref:SUKH-4 family immunity protein n=1 Tax=Streptomyces sp. NPDC099050 TaxID=3366100 RepID=UPI0038274985